MGKKDETAIAKKQDTAMVEQGTVTALAAADCEAGNMGLDGINAARDVAIPFIYVLQAMSPQVKRGMPQRIEGAEEGMLYNNVTGEIIKPPLTVVPCFFRKAWVEWGDRDNGGGFVQQHDTDSILKETTLNEKKLNLLPNGNHIVETAYHYVLTVKPDGSYERAVISMTRTQLKKSRRWLSQILASQLPGQDGTMHQAPMFSNSYLINTVVETMEQYSWFGFAIGDRRPIESTALYLAARLFNHECKAGLVKINKPEDELMTVASTEEHI